MDFFLWFSILFMRLWSCDKTNVNLGLMIFNMLYIVPDIVYNIEHKLKFFTYRTPNFCDHMIKSQISNLMCTTRSGITVIRYAPSQKIGKPIILGLKRNSQNWPYHNGSLWSLKCSL